MVDSTGESSDANALVGADYDMPLYYSGEVPPRDYVFGLQEGAAALFEFGSLMAGFYGVSEGEVLPAVIGGLAYTASKVCRRVAGRSYSKEVLSVLEERLSDQDSKLDRLLAKLDEESGQK